MPAGKLHVGTSGWSYAHWARGRFYPRGLKAGEWLQFFAERFATVEVNTTFYRLPGETMVTRWAAVTPPDFRFALKLWRRITHEKRLIDCGEEVREFFAAVAPLGAKRGPLLVQLPPSQRRDTARLDTFLADLKEAAGRTPWHVAVECRNRDWIGDELTDVLDRHDAALCLADMPRCSTTEPNASSFVYVRRHGPTGHYQERYSGAVIRKDAARVREWLDAGRDVFVYFNNDIEGYAVENARELIEAVENVHHET